MTSIHRFDRDGKPHPTATGLMRPDTLHLRYTCGFKLVPHGPTSVRATIKGVIVWRHCGNSTQQNGVISVHKRFNPNGGFRMHIARVISWPFPKWPLVNKVIRMYKTLESDLCICRHWQAGFWHINHLNPLADQASSTIVFIFTVGHF